MSGEERLNEFIVAIDNWVELKGLPEIKLRPEIEETIKLQDFFKKIEKLQLLNQCGSCLCLLFVKF